MLPAPATRATRGISFAAFLVMARNQASKQYNSGSDHKTPEDNGSPSGDREPERGGERIGSAHKLRDRADVDDKDDDGVDRDDGYDDGYAGYSRIYDEDLEYHAESRLPAREDEDEDEGEDDDVIDIDIMEVLDHDDLTQMDGPDA